MNMDKVAAFILKITISIISCSLGSRTFCHRSQLCEQLSCEEREGVVFAVAAPLLVAVGPVNSGRGQSTWQTELWAALYNYISSSNDFPHSSLITCKLEDFVLIRTRHIFASISLSLDRVECTKTLFTESQFHKGRTTCSHTM